MNYQFANENINYEDFSSGRVLYNQQGATSFPVRLASEIFLRCVNYLEKKGKDGPYVIYDPLCGGAYSMTTLGFLFPSRLKKIYVSDIDKNIIGLAQKNLSLLTEEGLLLRKNQIEKMYQEYGKESHQEALMSVDRLLRQLKLQDNQPETFCIQADAMALDNSCFEDKIDIVFSDLPYGDVVDWINVQNEEEAITTLLGNLIPLLSETAIVVLSARKKFLIQSEYYQKVEQFKIGKRYIILLQPHNNL